MVLLCTYYMLGIYIIQYIYEVEAIKLAFLSSEVQEITLGFNINCVQYNTGGFYCIMNIIGVDNFRGSFFAAFNWMVSKLVR